MMSKREGSSNEIQSVDAKTESKIYLDSLLVMEARLKDLASQPAKNSNIADVSSNMNVARLEDLINNLKHFETLRQNSLSWINNISSNITKAKQHLDEMASETTVLQDEQLFTNLLKVINAVL